jgi:23S rRNA pseudouridine2605 synthase
MVFDGLVLVNGEIVREPSHSVRPGQDEIRVEGRPVAPPEDWLIYAFHKPPGYLCTRSDVAGRRTIMDLLGDLGRMVFPVGRLDRNSEGLLILTNHGDLAHGLLHPRFEIEKTYVVTLTRPPRSGDIKRLGRGVPIGPGEWARPVSVERAGGRTTLRIVLTEGKKREVRRMVRAVGHEVSRLVRVSFAGIQLGELPVGRWRPLTEEERHGLEEVTGMDLRPPPWAPPGSGRRGPAAARDSRSGGG